MKLNKKLYKDYTKQHAPKSRVFKNSLTAFFVGGGICVLGQGIKDLLSLWIGDEDTLATAVSGSLIFISCLLTSLGVYDSVAKHAGAGTLVPITGFANATISPALDARSEGWITGIGAKIFTVAGPVILYGTVASVVYGIVYWMIQTLN